MATASSKETVVSLLPPKPVFRRADIRRIPGGYPPDIRAPEESSGWIFRDVTDGTGSRLSLHWSEIAAGDTADLGIT